MEEKPEERVVHIITPEGKPLCGFSSKIVTEWPEGHIEVDDDINSRKYVTCHVCKKEIEKMEGEREKPRRCRY